MRRLLTILCVLVLVLSCVDTQTAGQGEIVTDPVSECILPEAVRCGEDVILQWNGFDQAASILMRSSSGEDTVVEIGVITASGLIFNVPFIMLPGIYDIVLIQEGEFTLGRIEVLPPSMPVSGVSMPSSALAEEVILIKGMGFDSSSKLIFIASDGTEYEIVPEYVSGGLSIALPDSLPEGEYTVVLVQDGYRWTINASFQLMSVARTLASVAYQGPYSGTTNVRYTWTISEAEPLTIVLSEVLVDADGTIEEGSYDEYTAVSGSAFELSADGFEMSNDLEMSYNIDSDGLISTSDVLVYGNSKPTEFVWTYDAYGYLTEVTYESKSGVRTFRSLFYENGNLVQFRNTMFDYADPTLKNHPDAPDVVWGYMSVMEKFDPFLYFPYFLGWYDKTSAYLPTSMTIASGTGTVTLPLTYVFDDDGYVTEMRWMDGGENKVMFTYR
ncbi:MAG: DUF4595 domain-containing protein [Bacteroidales bacterium]|nr:DUF4595 domain-containing protein [Bacteroidales bacterium]